MLTIMAVTLLLFYRLDRSSHEANLQALRSADTLMDPITTTPIPNPPIP